MNYIDVTAKIIRMKRDGFVEIIVHGSHLPDLAIAAIRDGGPCDLSPIRLRIECETCIDIEPPAEVRQDAQFSDESEPILKWRCKYDGEEDIWWHYIPARTRAEAVWRFRSFKPFSTVSLEPHSDVICEIAPPPAPSGVAVRMPLHYRGEKLPEHLL